MKHVFWWMSLHARSAIVIAAALTLGCDAEDSVDTRTSGFTDPAFAPNVNGAAGSGGGFADEMGALPTGMAQGLPGADPAAGGMEGFAGMGGGMFDGTPVGAEPLPQEDVDLGMGDGSDVVAIGDSWMNLNGGAGIQQSLVAASGQPYRVFGVPATRLLDEVIPNQYAQAKAENPNIKTVVVAGGGNDILQNPLGLVDCPALGQACKDIIDMIIARYASLADEMAADGVQDAIIVVYSRGTALGAAPIDYVYDSTMSSLAPACDSAGIRCHIVDADEVSGGTMELRDGIHPTDANYDLLGQYIYDLMVNEGMRR